MPRMLQVVEGNHEANAPWKNEVHQILTNATFLKNEGVMIDGVRIHGKGSIFLPSFFFGLLIFAFFSFPYA
jgi:hypothetical protein